MANVKHYVITSITLGSIAAVSALAIGLSNLVTKNKIKENAAKRINASIVELFGEGSSIKEEISTENKGYQYVEKIYAVSNNDSLIGYGFQTTGSNMYGKISLMVGYDVSYTFKGIYEIVNEQTYASTLEDNYIIPLNNNTHELDDVSCGATYGATLVRDMVYEAKTALDDLLKV